jgi:hypothetical protein
VGQAGPLVHLHRDGLDGQRGYAGR